MHALASTGTNTETPPAAPSEGFDLIEFTNGLVDDLHKLRAGQISNEAARLRSDLARQILRAVNYIMIGHRRIEAVAARIDAGMSPAAALASTGKPGAQGPRGPQSHPNPRGPDKRPRAPRTPRAAGDGARPAAP